MIHDAAIIGLGAMGSAAAYHLAKRGLTVLGIDQFDPPHSKGSSHGETRVIREAYFEHPIYVPLVQRAYELWSDLAETSGERLYLQTGGLMVGAADSVVVSGSLRSAREHSLPYELLDCSMIKNRFPGLTPPPGMSGVLEPRAGIVFPERCLAAHLRLARKCGADLRMNQRALSWEASGDSVVVHMPGESFVARRLIVCAGAWLPKIFPGWGRNFSIERQVLLWFQARRPDFFRPDRFPIHLWEYEPNKMFYGFPDLGDGVKVAFHHQGVITDADAVDRHVEESDIEAMRELLKQFLPEANGSFLRGTVCLYTNTPDGHFVIDFQPGTDRVVIASPCSGHGFKFASAIGEVLADLATEGASRFDLSLFRVSRFGAA